MQTVKNVVLLAIIKELIPGHLNHVTYRFHNTKTLINWICSLSRDQLSQQILNRNVIEALLGL